MAQNFTIATQNFTAAVTEAAAAARRFAVEFSENPLVDVESTPCAYNGEPVIDMDDHVKACLDCHRHYED